MQTEFEWTIFPRFKTLGILEEVQKIMKSFQCEPEHFNGRIIFMSMFHLIVCGENDNTEECNQNAIEVSKYARRFPFGRWSFLGPGLEKTWYKTCSDKPNKEWDRTATKTGDPVFRASRKRAVRQKRTWQKVHPVRRSWRKHRDAFRKVISVNQLSIHGVLEDWCKNGDKKSS